jgi:flagellar hook-basal body complex protein FliE
VSPVGGVGAAGIGTAGVGGLTPPALSQPPGGATGGAAKSSFQNGLDAVSKSISAADTASAQVATGTATDLHQVTVAATKAQLGVSLTVAMRNKAVEAYQEIMRMSV